MGTNAYWLPYLNSDDDIRNTLANMSASGITVVRTWAFNGAGIRSLYLSSLILLGQIDVSTIPDAGSWLLLIENGNTTINTGPNGFQRLDKIIAIAKEYNIYVYFTLTNNWFPFVNDSPSPLPRNYLCTSYGQYLILAQLSALDVDWILRRWYGSLCSGVWCSKDP